MACHEKDRHSLDNRRDNGRIRFLNDCRVHFRASLPLQRHRLRHKAVIIDAMRLPVALAALLKHHSEIFTFDFWRAIQRQIRASEVREVFPYKAQRRLANDEASIFC
jgi:Isocitrate dehydrogenase kinase/phosphatase (AceK)